MPFFQTVYLFIYLFVYLFIYVFICLFKFISQQILVLFEGTFIFKIFFFILFLDIYSLI